MQHVTAERIAALLDYKALIEALRLAHRRGPPPEVSWKVATDRDNAANKFVQLHAWASGEAIAVKLVGVFPGNLARDPPEPSIQGLVILFDGKTGAPILTADGAEMTFRKTAADSALAADYLAGREARVLLVAGAGGAEVLEEQGEVVGRRCEHHAGQCEEREREELGLPGLEAVAELGGHEQHEQRGAGHRCVLPGGPLLQQVVGDPELLRVDAEVFGFGPGQRGRGRGRGAAGRRHAASSEQHVHGVRACAALFAHRPGDVIRVYVSANRKPTFKALLAHCATNRLGFQVVDDDSLRKLSGGIHHEGIVILAREPARLGAGALVVGLALVAVAWLMPPAGLPADWQPRKREVE